MKDITAKVDRAILIALACIALFGLGYWVYSALICHDYCVPL